MHTGEVIIEESPLVIGPKQITRPVCLGCYNDVDGHFKCPTCGWPMCGAECCTSADHAAECQLTPKSRKDQIQVDSYKEIEPIYQSVMVLRCLHLKEAQPDRWRQLLQLQSHCVERKNNGLEEVDRDVIVQFIRQVLQLDIDELLILQICGILYVNSFEIPFNQQGLQAIYSTASLFEHDCVANAVKTFTSKGKIVIRAAVPIPRKEKIALCYTDPWWGTANRQHHLKQTKFFVCRCDRCKDPTEMSTFISGLRCPRCPDASDAQSVLLPQNPLDESAQWLCTGCSQPQPVNYVNQIIEKIGKELVSLKRGSIEHCEIFIKKYENVLHPHHFYLIDVKMALCQMYGHLEGQNMVDLSEDMLNQKEALCLQLLKIADVISPGNTSI